MSRNRRFEFGLKTLDQEHAEIRRQYLELDDAILQGHGSPRILEAAGNLMELMRLHLAHEERFQEEIAFPLNAEQHRKAKRTATELLHIEQGLQGSEVYAALRLRSLCKGWMRDHLYMENLEFEIACVATGNKALAGARD